MMKTGDKNAQLLRLRGKTKRKIWENSKKLWIRTCQTWNKSCIMQQIIADARQRLTGTGVTVICDMLRDGREL